VKGMRDEVSVFALTGARRHDRPRLLTTDDLPPMVGRHAELQRFGAWLADAQQGNGQIIGVIGGAGIGKSRFIAAGTRPAQARGFAVYAGECEGYGHNASYHVWQPIWRELLALDPRQSLGAQMDALDAILGAIDPSLRLRAPLLGPVLGLDLPDNDLTRAFDPELRKTSLESLLADLLRALASAQPRMLVLEECQWLDDLSYDLVETLGRAVADVPVLMVLAFRPAELAGSPAQRVATLPNYRALELKELTSQELNEIAQARLQRLPQAQTGGAVHPTLLARIVAQAEGNPFYLEELINFIHHQEIDPTDAAALTRMDLPNSLQSLVLSRIDQLGEHEKTTLRAAGIIGRTFRVAWLTGYYPELGEPATVQGYLAQLHRFDLTLPASFESELTYLFKHIITYEVTYASLPFATRARLHARVARYLEAQVDAGAIAESTVLDALVYHYTRTPHQDKQRHYLQRAAAAALRVSAFAAARDYLTQLLALTPTSAPDRSALERRLGDVHSRLGDYTAAQTALEQALAADRTDADRAATRTLLAQIAFQKGDYAAAQATLLETVPLARAGGDMTVLCRALTTLGRVNWRLGDMDGVVAAFDEALKLARSIGDVTRELAALNGLGVAFLHTDGAKAERLLTDVLTLASAANNRERVMIALSNLGVLEDERANDAAARDYHQQALSIARELGTQYYIAHHLSNLAGSEIALGDLDNAKQRTHEALIRHSASAPTSSPCRRCATPWKSPTPKETVSGAGAGGAHAAPARGATKTRAGWTRCWPSGNSPAEAEAYMAKGDDLDWDDTIQAILRERPQATGESTAKDKGGPRWTQMNTDNYKNIDFLYFAHKDRKSRQIRRLSAFSV
ncbi:MAG: AAA family ATPase, partial [Caldilineaceae bacterium]